MDGIGFVKFGFYESNFVDVVVEYIADSKKPEQDQMQDLTKRGGARARSRQEQGNMRPGPKTANTNVVHRYHGHS